MAHLQMLGVTERMSAEVVEIWQGYLAGRCYRMSGRDNVLEAWLFSWEVC